MLMSMQPMLFYRAERPIMMCSLTAIFTTGASTIGNNLSARSRQTARFFISKGKTIGQPTPPECIACHVVGLALILNDGLLFILVGMDRQSLEWS